MPLFPILKSYTPGIQATLTIFTMGLAYHTQGSYCYTSSYYKYYNEQHLAVTLADVAPVRRWNED